MTDDATRSALLNELAKILGVATVELPIVFKSRFLRVLKVGIDVDLRERFPDAEPEPVKDWLRRYTSSPMYLRRMIRRAKHRHDLDGNDIEPISQNDRRYARKLLSAAPLKTSEAAA